ncbi:hypothetical protein BU64_11800 [Escherichia coli O128:H2 str. 2011C-3317]|nr:hypothetical protein BU64_11800 [Escherichia coli O128:H2 str. 2011C-3317]
MAVRALINLNERFIDAVSNQTGIIGLFLGLLTVFAILLRFFIYRRLRKKTAAFEQAVSALVQRERDFNETVNATIARGIRQEKEQLARRREEFHTARQKASRAMQRIVDSAWKFKAKTLLAGVTINNWQSKYDQLRKEKEAYAAVSEKIAFLNLEDNSDWESVRQQFLDKVALLEKRRKRRNIRQSLSVRYVKKKSVRMNLTGASGKRKRKNGVLLSSRN